MKKNKTLYFFIILPIIITSISLFFLPEQVPIRYSSKEIQYGSKFSLLVLSFLGAWIGGLMALIAKAVENTEEGLLVRKIFYIPVVIFNVVNFITVAGAFFIKKDGSGLKMIEVTIGCLTGAIAIALGIYASFTAKQKGPILSNSYLWLSEEEKKKADTKAEYQMLTRVFGGLALAFTMLTLEIFTTWKWTLIAMWICIAFVIIYAVYDSVKSTVKK